MQVDVAALGAGLREDTGILFTCNTGKSSSGEYFADFYPQESSREHSFTIRLTIGWRRIQIDFIPGKFARDLLAEMGSSDKSSQISFISILERCGSDGAEIELRVNGTAFDYRDAAIWNETWHRFLFCLKKGHLALDEQEGQETLKQLLLQFSAAIISILPLENEPAETELAGFPEGAKTQVLVNRYERDRRNRAAALAIHGSRCKACDLNLAEKYGTIANGFIEIHHTTPASKIGDNYVIDPATDLVPLCPNCHAIAHRKDPPFSPSEIRMMLSREKEM